MSLSYPRLGSRSAGCLPVDLTAQEMVLTIGFRGLNGLITRLDKCG